MSIGSYELTCQTTGDSCNITMPSITPKDGYEVVGWSIDNNSTTATYLPNSTYSINKNMVLFAVTKLKETTGKLSGSELSSFKSANNINKSSNIVVFKTIKSISGISFNVYYLYDETILNSSQLKNFKLFMEHSLTNLSRVDTKVLRYVKSSGTDLIFYGTPNCDAYIVENNLSSYNYAGYCNSLTRDIIIGYEENRLNFNYYEEAIIHEFGHAFDFTLRYQIIGDKETGITALTRDNILNGFTNKNNVFISSSQVINLFEKDGTGKAYGWPELAKSDASKLKSITDFSAYSTNDLMARPYEFFADVFRSYYTPSRKSQMKSVASNTYLSIQKVINFIN